MPILSRAMFARFISHIFQGHLEFSFFLKDENRWKSIANYFIKQGLAFNTAYADNFPEFTDLVSWVRVYSRTDLVSWVRVYSHNVDEHSHL